ncbi:MAG: indolepyruvate oxidoreductase subunit beta [Dethiobacter sp.]|jgi:indolepyruvate ferredoxin oxidoreductase beta subunit|nr:indolepyruvate oxidoreductase subunit beta [Dethiobacter sp.]
MSEHKVTSVLMVGVGGQGIILASKILAQVVLKQGLELKISEIHGMAQRGGSVVTHLRFGAEVHTPLIDTGQADYMIASEKLEAWRWLPMLRRGGTVVVSTQEIKPVPVIIGAQKYPDGIMGNMEAMVGEEIGYLYALNALEVARACGQPRAANVVLSGVLSRCLGFSPQHCDEALQEVVPSRFLEENRKAFAAGFDYFVKN